MARHRYRDMHITLEYAIGEPKKGVGRWTFFEDLDATGYSAEDAGRRVVDEFNRTLRRGEEPRVFVSAYLMPFDYRPRKHDWWKTSLVTEAGGYDRMRCRRCGITGKRYGYGQGGVAVDKKYAKYERKCNEAVDRKGK